MKEIPIRCPYEGCGKAFTHSIPEGPYSARIKCKECNKPIILEISTNQVKIETAIDLKKLKKVRTMADQDGFLGS